MNMKISCVPCCGAAVDAEIEIYGNVLLDGRCLCVGRCCCLPYTPPQHAQETTKTPEKALRRQGGGVLLGSLHGPDYDCNKMKLGGPDYDCKKMKPEQVCKAELRWRLQGSSRVGPLSFALAGLLSIAEIVSSPQSRCEGLGAFPSGPCDT